MGAWANEFLVTETIPHTGVSRPASRNAAVELRSVTKRYGDVVALREISLTIHEGEFFSLLGPSGCGKTTTLSLIGGFICPEPRDIVIQGRSVGRSPPYRRPVHTGFLSYSPLPHTT